MKENEFKKICINLVRNYTNDHLDPMDDIKIVDKDVFIVWSCKILQNNKALLSTVLYDGMYYEITFNGDKKEIYFDAYKKFENKCIKLEYLEKDN